MKSKSNAIRISPRVLVSRCLEFEACRWDGSMISDPWISRFKNYFEFIPLCPESDIDLGIPRPPIRVVRDADGDRLVQPSTGLDITDTMIQYCRRRLDQLPEIDGAILKSRSPSCGLHDVKLYNPKPDSPVLGKTTGFFGRQVLDRYSHLAIEDEGRLTNFKLREHFLTRLYSMALLRELKEKGSMGKLVQFHADHKYLLMAYSITQLRLLGRIVANPEQYVWSDVIHSYAAHFSLAFLHPPRTPSIINVLMHTMGYFSDRLTADEKAYFLDCLEEYRQGKLPLSVCTHMMESWIIRFQEPYLADQRFFHPYPTELSQISDSGKGHSV
ncbi:MAG: DUF523 and DUF1722 domain-containing protein [Candidatus Delongbacteria bacterium]|nr:DUF523 and DUF1722 domain-containing protein [Candidatus Delongbacteria bacterium]